MACVFSRAIAELATGTLPTGGLCLKKQMLHCLEMTTCVIVAMKRLSVRAFKPQTTVHADMIRSTWIMFTNTFKRRLDWDGNTDILHSHAGKCYAQYF